MANNVLPSFNTKDIPFSLMQSAWSKILNPLISNPINNGFALKGIKLVSGNNVINHRLQRNLQGYIITAMYDSFAQIYSTESQQPTLTLNLNASAPTTIDLWVF